MPAQSLLPASLDQLKLQANELQRGHRDCDASAAARVAAHHPGMKTLSPEAGPSLRPLALADAQLVIAREDRLCQLGSAQASRRHYCQPERSTPHPRFGDALAAIDAGDLKGFEA